MRIKITGAFLVLMALFTSCVNEELEIPNHIIAKDTLVEMLVEIQIFEAIKKVKGDRNQLTMDIREAYDYEFEKFDVTEEKFIESMKFYAKNQKTFEEIFNEVIVRIAEREGELTSKKNQK